MLLSNIKKRHLFPLGVLFIVLLFVNSAKADYGYYGYFEEEDTEPLPERAGWFWNASVGGSFGEIGYGFNSPYFSVAFNMRRYLKNNQWMRIGFGTSYCRSSIYNENYDFHPVFYNNTKDQFHISFMNDFFLLSEKRVSPWAGYGVGLFYMRAKGLYNYIERHYDNFSGGWVTTVDEEREKVLESFMVGVLVNIGLRVIISQRVDLEGYLSQTFGLTSLQDNVLVQIKDGTRIYNVYKAPTAETVFYGGFVISM